MKKKKLNKKLFLHKHTVANLNPGAMKAVYGGGGGETWNTCSRCPDLCETETCETCIDPTQTCYCTNSCGEETCNTCPGGPSCP